MSRALQGIIIRCRRQELNWSQTTLCADICAVSYLSRIEQGKVNGSDEVLELLLKQMGVHWQEDPDFCGEASAWFEGWHDRLFAGDSSDRLKPVFARAQEKYWYSPFFLDWLLLSWQITGEIPDGVEEFIPAMDTRQRNLYLCLTQQQYAPGDLENGATTSLGIVGNLGAVVTAMYTVPDTIPATVEPTGVQMNAASTVAVGEGIHGETVTLQVTDTMTIDCSLAVTDLSWDNGKLYALLTAEYNGEMEYLFADVSRLGGNTGSQSTLVTMNMEDPSIEKLGLIGDGIIVSSLFIR